jgi:hypothetical protein
MANWVYFNFEINTNIHGLILQKSCIDENYDIAKYIYSLHKFNDNIIDKIYKDICYIKSPSFIKWYCHLTEIDKREAILKSYIFCCKCKNLHIYQTIDSINDFDIYIEDLNDCLNGHRENLKRLKKRNNNIYSINVKYVQQELIDENKKYYFDIENIILHGRFITFTDVNLYFLWLCMYQDVETISMVYNNCNVDIYYDNGIILNKSCERGDIDIVEFLISRRAHLKYGIKMPFYNVCKYGHLNIAQFFHVNNLLSTIENFSEFFHSSCYYGRNNIAMWLYQTFSSKISVNEKDNLSLKWCCLKNNIELAKFIYSLGGIDLGMNNNDLLVNSCQDNNIEIVKWLYAEGVDIYSSINVIISICCNKRNDEIIKWIFSLDEKIDMIFELVFTKGCKSKYMEILLWLKSLNENEFIKLAKKNFYDACLIDDLDIAQTILSLECFTIDDEIIQLCYSHDSYSIIELLEKYNNFH